MSTCRKPIVRVLSQLRLRCTGQIRLGSTQFADTSQVPEDPDILTTQDLDALDISTAHHQPHEDVKSISMESKFYPRLQYYAPALGVNPAYDLALEIIKQDRAAILSKYYITNQKIKKLTTDSSIIPKVKESQIRDMTIFASTLKELADMNDPEIHWRHAKGDVDLSMPVFRRLARSTWSHKTLRLLNQRVTQMSVTPDVIPLISPTVDVRLTFPARLRGPRPSEFEAGGFLNSKDSAFMPKIEIQQFDAREKLYSIAIVDPDVPNEASDTFTSFLHYLKKDVALTCTKHDVDGANGNIIHDYIPPHPHKGTDYHRYVVVVWEQPQIAPQPTAPLAGNFPISREGFDAQSFAQQNGLHAVGINFWRQVWDERVANLMQQYPHIGYAEKEFKRIKA